jgi:hypothetical protein
MDTNNNKPDDFIITIKPDATPEELKRFTNELAYAILAIARHTVDNEPAQELEDIEEACTDSGAE